MNKSTDSRIMEIPDQRVASKPSIESVAAPQAHMLMTRKRRSDSHPRVDVEGGSAEVGGKRPDKVVSTTLEAHVRRRRLAPSSMLKRSVSRENGVLNQHLVHNSPRRRKMCVASMTTCNPPRGERGGPS
jgi:hypothetical protein